MNWIEGAIVGDNYFWWMLPGILITLYANFRLRRTFNKYKKIKNRAGVTGKETGRQILDSEELQKVKIKQVPGNLTDNYDPRDEVLNLSKPIYGKNSVGAMGVAAHESGHAIQDKDGYFFMRLRSFIVPFANIGTNFGYILIVAGLILNMSNLSKIGVALFALTTLFALVTIPVEFNASSRAKDKLRDLGLTRVNEDEGVEHVLNAARFTYVAAFATSGIQLAYWWLQVRHDAQQQEARAEANQKTKQAQASADQESGSKQRFGRSKTVAPVSQTPTSPTSSTDAATTDTDDGGLFGALVPKRDADSVDENGDGETAGFGGLWKPATKVLSKPSSTPESRRR